MAQRTVNPPEVFDSLQYGFSQAVVATGGTRIHLSGQVGVDAEERTVGPDLASQTAQAFRNIELVLAHADADLRDVVMLRIYLTAAAARDQEAIAEALQAHFPTDPPASSWVVVTALSEPEWLVEIEAEAVLDGAGGSDARA